MEGASLGNVVYVSRVHLQDVPMVLVPRTSLDVIPRGYCRGKIADRDPQDRLGRSIAVGTVESDAGDVFGIQGTAPVQADAEMTWNQWESVDYMVIEDCEKTTATGCFHSCKVHLASLRCDCRMLIDLGLPKTDCRHGRCPNVGRLDLDFRQFDPSWQCCSEEMPSSQA
jgi:hypothetical protein